MKLEDFNDKEIGRFRVVLVAILALCILYLVILLPWSPNAGVIGSAIGALCFLIGGILSASALRRGRDGNGTSNGGE